MKIGQVLSAYWAWIATIGLLVVPLYVLEYRHSQDLATLRARISDLRLSYARDQVAPDPIQELTATVPLEGAVTIGNAKSRIGIIEYLDFHCPFCARFAKETLPSIRRKYVDTGRVLFGFKNLPIDSLHPLASVTSRAAVCADVQGRFWKFHDWFFGHPLPQTAREVSDVGALAGLEIEGLGRCLSEVESSERVRRQSAEAGSLAITGTPSFLFGTIDHGSLTVSRRVDGAQPLLTFEAVLDELLATEPGRIGR